MIKTLLLAPLAWALATFPCQLQAATEVTKIATKPNILIILADDMGYSDLGAMGGDAETPNLDALAKDGVLLANFYNNAKCAPSRASLMTGLSLISTSSKR